MSWLLIGLLIVAIFALLVAATHEGSKLATSLNLHVANTTEENTMIPVVLTESQKVTLSIAPTDRNGEPAAVENAVWFTESEIINLTPSEDGLSCLVETVGETGQVEVSVTADADLGEGVVELSETALLTIVDDIASGLNLTASTPEFV